MAHCAILAWVAVVFAAYVPAFRVHPSDVLRAFSSQGLPVEPAGAARAWFGFFQAALVAAAVLLAVRGAGRPATRLIGVRGSAWLGAIPAGLGLAGALVLGLGLVGTLFPPVLWVVAAALIASGGFPSAMALFPEGTPRLAVALAALVAVAALPGALAPEVTYDALAYHLGAPELFLRLHRIVRCDHMMFTDFPLAIQMSYLLGLALGGGDGAAKLVHFALGIGSVGAAAFLGGRLGGRTAAGWAAACFAATPMLATQMTKANADLGVVLPAAAGAWWLAGPRRGSSLAMAGLLFGCAAASKLTGGYALCAGLAVAVALGTRAKPTRVSAAAILVAAAAVPLVPWLAKAWLAAGNPVHPFLSRWLGGVGWTAANAAAWAKDMTEANSFNIQYPNALARLAAPWSCVMHDRGSAAALGPFALALLPAFLWVAPPARRAAARLGIFAAACWLCWFASARDPRFLLPAWPAACALAGCVAGELEGRAGTAVRWAVALGAAVTVPFVAAEVGRGPNPGPVLWGAVPREAYADYLLAPPRVYVPLMRVAGAAADGGTLLVVGDVKAPFVRVRAWYPSMFDTPHLEAWVAESASPERLAVRFRQHRVRSVFFHQGGSSYLREKFGPFTWTLRDRAVLRAFWERRLEPVRETRDSGWLLGVYRVGAPSAARRSLPIPGDAP